MKFSVVQECPQCGAPVDLEETDRLLRCPYCDVKSFLLGDPYFRFVLPPKDPGRGLIYLPYLRFRGSSFTCRMDGVRHRILDITHLGVPFKRFPISLGLRPQAMKMQFVKADTRGTFLRCLLKTRDLLVRAERHSTSQDPGNVFHRAFIGDALSLIYLPMYVERGALFDGITERPLARLPREKEMLSSIVDKAAGRGITFLATLCPDCGWNLQGERDSVVLTCPNCETAWEVREGRFVRVDFHVGTGGEGQSVYLPFWRMSVEARGMDMRSFADFMRVTNQPRVIRREWENEELRFWCPAFKIRPKVFLHLSRHLTLLRPGVNDTGRLPVKRLYPVTLPLSEALEGIKVTLAGCIITRNKMMPLLPETSFSIRETSLVYLPFHQGLHEMVEPNTRISINRKALEFGRYL